MCKVPEPRDENGRDKQTQSSGLENVTCQQTPTRWSNNPAVCVMTPAWHWVLLEHHKRHADISLKPSRHKARSLGCLATRDVS